MGCTVGITSSAPAEKVTPFLRSYLLVWREDLCKKCGPLLIRFPFLERMVDACKCSPRLTSLEEKKNNKISELHHSREEIAAAEQSFQLLEKEYLESKEKLSASKERAKSLEISLEQISSEICEEIKFGQLVLLPPAIISCTIQHSEFF